VNLPELSEVTDWTEPFLEALTVTPEIGKLLIAIEPLRVRVAGVAVKF